MYRFLIPFRGFWCLRGIGFWGSGVLGFLSSGFWGFGVFGVLGLLGLGFKFIGFLGFGVLGLWVRSEQAPLQLSEAEMEEIFSAVCSVSTSAAAPPVSRPVPLGGPASVTDPSDLAAAVLIKLLMDM